MSKRTLIVLGCLALAVGCASATLSAQTARPGAKIVERIIARVNSEIITQRQFEQERAKLRQQLSQDYSGADLEVQFREQSKNLLRDLIDQSLMVQKAKDLDINVETDVVKQLDDIRKKNHLSTLEDLETAVEKEGLNYEDFKDQIRRNQLMREVIGREVGSRIMLSREDARKYYEAHKKEFESPGMIHLSQIFISFDKWKPEEAAKRSNEAMAELKAGQRFADVAKKYSDGPTADQGGDVGYAKVDALAPDVAAAVAKLDIHEFTDPMKKDSGYLIFEIQERFSTGIPKFEEVESRVNEILYDQKLQPNLREYMSQLRKDSYIYLAPGYVDSGAERPSETQLAKGQ